MATPDLIGLFGQDPQLIQQAMDLQRAQLTPEQRMYTMGAQTGRSIGQGLGSLFGVDVQDPLVQKATALRSLAKEFDTTTPEGLMQFAQAASKIDPRAGMLAAQQAQAMQTSRVEAVKKGAEASKTLFDSSMAGKALELAKTGKYTSESIDKYIKGEGDLVPIDKEVKPDSAFVAIANELGYGAKPSYGAYTPQQTAQINAELQKRKIQQQIAGANRMSVIQQQESSFAKQRGEMQAKSLAESEVQAKTSANALERLATMETKNKGQMLTGPLAGTAIGAGQFLSSLGLLSPESARTLANSEVYDKSAKDLVMQDLGGKLGGQVSDADRNYIEARIPQLKNSQQARTELITKLKEIHKKNIGYYQNMSKYANKHGNLNDFDFAQNAPAETAKPTIIKLD